MLQYDDPLPVPRIPSKLTSKQKYYNPMDIGDAAALTPEIELQALLSELSPKDFTIDRIIVASPKYLEALSGILKETNKDVVEAYFKWKAVQSLTSFIESDSVKPYKRFRNELSGKVSIHF